MDQNWLKKTSCIFNPFPNKPWIICVCSISLLKTLLEKEKLLVTSNFSFSHSVFYPFGELSAIFIEFKIVVCKCFILEESKICRFGKGLSVLAKETLKHSMLRILIKPALPDYEVFLVVLAEISARDNCHLIASHFELTWAQCA